MKKLSTIPVAASEHQQLSSDQIGALILEKSGRLTTARRQREGLVEAAYGGNEGAKSELDTLTAAATRLQLEIEDLQMLKEQAERREQQERERLDAQKKKEREEARNLALGELVKLGVAADRKLNELKEALEAIEARGKAIISEFPEDSSANNFVSRLTAGRLVTGGHGDGNRTMTAAGRRIGLQRYIQMPYVAPVETKTLEEAFRLFIQQA